MFIPNHTVTIVPVANNHDTKSYYKCGMILKLCREIEAPHLLFWRCKHILCDFKAVFSRPLLLLSSARPGRFGLPFFPVLESLKLFLWLQTWFPSNDAATVVVCVSFPRLGFPQHPRELRSDLGKGGIGRVI